MEAFPDSSSVRLSLSRALVERAFVGKCGSILLTVCRVVLRPRSTVGLSRTIRSVAAGTQWSRPLKSLIVYEFLPCCTTGSGSESSPLACSCLVALGG